MINTRWVVVSSDGCRINFSFVKRVPFCLLLLFRFCSIDIAMMKTIIECSTVSKNP